MIQNCTAQRTEIKLKLIPRIKQPKLQEVGQPTIRELFDAEENSLVRYAFSLVGRRAVAEEIVQEVFLQLHKHWNDVECPRAWLFRSVRNRAYNHRRDNRREFIGSDVQDAGAADTENETAEALFIRREAVGSLRQIVEELDEDDRQLVKMKYFDNLKYCDISAQTGLSVGNVGYRLHHILKRLAERMSQFGIDEMS